MTIVWLLITLLAGLSLLLFLLAVPIDVDYNFNSQEDRQSYLAIIWLFGLVKVDATGQQKKQKTARQKQKIKIKPKPKHHRPKRSREKKSRDFKRLLNVLRSEGFIKHLLRFLLNLFRQINIRAFYLAIRFGLDNPADTGQLYGIVAPFAMCIQAMPFTNIYIQPEFSSMAFHRIIKIQVRIVPIRFVWMLILFVLSPNTFRAIKAFIKTR